MPPDHVFEDPLDGEDLRLQCRDPPLVPGQIQEVGDDTFETAGFPARGFQVARARIGIDRHVGQRQRVEVAAHRGQRCAQLV